MCRKSEIHGLTRGLLIVFGLVGLISCDRSVLNSDAQLDEPFWLLSGDSKFLPSEQLEIGFDKLLTDSRCPENGICVWAGEAQVRLWLRKPAAERTFVTATIAGYVTAESTSSHASVDTLGYRITLLQLDPYPNTNRERREADYRALFNVESVL